MIKNYFKIAFRNLVKNKVFSFINIFGLTIGISCCMLITAFVYDELSYDTYPVNAKQIYRIGLHVTGNGDIAEYPSVDVAIGQGMKDAYPEILSFTRIFNRGEGFVNYGDKQFKEEHIAIADSNFLRFFSIPLIEGDPSTALTEPNTLVISRELAYKYFGSEKVTGKLLTINNRDLIKISGVIDKIPENAHFHFDILISMSTLGNLQQTWSNIGTYTYLQLSRDADPASLEAKFPQLVAKNIVPETLHDMGGTLAEAQKAVNTFRFYLTPLTKIHLYAHSKYELEANGDIQYVYIFSALAFFILLLACVNFTNLSTASSARRAREVGIRKVMGSVKKQLVAQFLCESVILTFCALILAIIIVFALLPTFNQLSGKHFTIGDFIGYKAIFSLVILGLGVGTLAGIYPSFYLSSFQPIQVLKGTFSQRSSKSFFRSGLVVFQFFVSTALIIATIIVYQQLHYMQKKNPGYNQDQVLYIQDGNLLGQQQMAFAEELRQNKNVSGVSMGRYVPGTPFSDGTEIYAKDIDPAKNGKEIHTNIYHVDYEYIPTLGIQVINGRNFSKDFLTDSSAAIINEAEVKDLGWIGQDPIGKSIIRSGQKECQVIGVIRDFHYASLKQKIAPLMLLPANRGGGFIVKFKAGDVPGLLADLKSQWNRYKPQGPFSYYFLDDKFASVYAAEQRTGQIFSSFSVIAILIASLGLFGLAAFITEQRTKELGIRKILGASIQQVLVLVSREFLILVIIAILISVPITWWGMHAWLQDFAYRINISWWVFIVAGAIAILIALLTVSWHSLKTALANPVKSLRMD